MDCHITMKSGAILTKISPYMLTIIQHYGRRAIAWLKILVINQLTSVAEHFRGIAFVCGATHKPTRGSAVVFQLLDGDPRNLNLLPWIGELVLSFCLVNNAHWSGRRIVIGHWGGGMGFGVFWGVPNVFAVSSRLVFSERTLDTKLSICYNAFWSLSAIYVDWKVEVTLLNVQNLQES